MLVDLAKKYWEPTVIRIIVHVGAPFFKHQVDFRVFFAIGNEVGSPGGFGNLIQSAA
mgnify:CR=1 FL=1